MTTPQPNPSYQPQPGSGKRLVRLRDDRMLAGVCSGLARYLNVDVTLVRVLVAVFTVLGGGTLGLAYLIAWLVMPEE